MAARDVVPGRGLEPLVAAAVRAPSVHNTRSWRYVLSPAPSRCTSVLWVITCRCGSGRAAAA